MPSLCRSSLSICCLLFVVEVTLTGQTVAQTSEEGPVWSDEFNGEMIDREIWTYDVGGHGWGNGQLEFNTDRPENSYVKDGTLVIEARREKFQGREFTSARMHTHGRFAFQYGTLAARIKVPDTADGIWPAFWMLGQNFPGVEWPKCGEVGILEIGGKDGIAQRLQQRRINSALHFAGKNEQKTSLVEWHDAPIDLNADFHVYQLVWTPQSMRFFLDDEEFASWQITAPEFREYHQPFYPILNVAVGSWTSSYTAIDAPDKVTAEFPAQMLVDWVRLYPNEHTKIVEKQTAEQANRFGVFTERSEITSRLEYVDGGDPEFPYGDRAALFLWNNVNGTESVTAFEGGECWSFEIGAGDWFGFGVMTPKHRDLTAYANGKISLAVKSRLVSKLKVGIKSSQGEAWVQIGDADDEFGFARDGKWHEIAIPVSRFETDLTTIHQPFMLAGDALTMSGSLAIDDVRWESTAASPPGLSD